MKVRLSGDIPYLCPVQEWKGGIIVARRKRPSKNTTARHLITKMNPHSPVAEQFKTLRANVQRSSLDGDVNAILLAAADPSEGKSSTTANLDIVCAQQGKRVLLIDADMRKPTLHYTFRLDNRKG